MLKTTFLILIFLVITCISSAQWSTDPANNLIVGYGLLPEIASDSAGGCYITYEQNLAYPRRLILERLNRYGYKPWGTNRRILGEFPEQYSAQVTEDGHGGVIVAYTDRWADSVLAWRLRVQRVDSSGNFLWGATGVRVSLSETNQGSQTIVSDGVGGCIVAWVNSVNSDTFTIEYHHRINRINGAGARVWGDSGKFVWNYRYQAPGRPVMIADGRGGCYLVVGARGLVRFDSEGNTYWPSPVQVPTGGGILRADGDANLYVFGSHYIGYNGQIIYSIHLQKVDTSGALLWDSVGVTIDTLNTNLFLNYDFCIQDGYSTIAWPQNTSGVWDLRTQIVRSDGSTLFQHGGIQVSEVPSRKIVYAVISSDSMTSIFIWADNRSPGGTFAQRLDTVAHRLWASTDVFVSNPPYSGGGKVTTDGAGGFIVAGFVQSDFSIRAQQVNKHGQLGQVITGVESNENQTGTEFLLHQNYPNPFNSATSINYTVAISSWINISLYNILGQRLLTLVNSHHLPGTYSTYLSADGFPSGVYYYRMQTQNGAMYTRKLLIIK